MPKHLLTDIEQASRHFASVSNNLQYNADNVYAFRRTGAGNDLDYQAICGEVWFVERLLRNMKRSAPGVDAIPQWFYVQCSYEIAHVVTHILTLSFTQGVVPDQWRTAIVSPVPKVTKPITITDYRPISVTPLLSRLAERLVVSNWLLPSLPPELIDDQFGFRPTGSTECALTFLMHHVASMLETATYVRCLMVDFSKAFDVVDHVILFKKLTSLSMPDVAINWFISFFSERKQYLKIDGKLSMQQTINSSVVQGSGVGPMCYVVMESDLRTLSLLNKLCKYADDTNLLVPSNSDVDLNVEFDNIKQWAINNHMNINHGKTKEIVFHRPSPKQFVYPAPVCGIEQVEVAKLLGVFFGDNFNYCTHVSTVLKLCAQRLYLLRLLRSQGLSRHNLNIVFQALVISRIVYCLPVWGGYITADQRGQINALFRRAYTRGFCLKVYSIEDLLDVADNRLFKAMQSSVHCLNPIMPFPKSGSITLRPRGHEFKLISCNFEFFKKSFLPRCLFKFL